MMDGGDDDDDGDGDDNECDDDDVVFRRSPHSTTPAQYRTISNSMAADPGCAHAS